MYNVKNQNRLMAQGFFTKDQAAAYVLDKTDKWPVRDIIEIMSPSDIVNVLQTTGNRPLENWTIEEAVIVDFEQYNSKERSFVNCDLLYHFVRVKESDIHESMMDGMMRRIILKIWNPYGREYNAHEYFTINGGKHLMFTRNDGTMARSVFVME